LPFSIAFPREVVIGKCAWHPAIGSRRGLARVVVAISDGLSEVLFQRFLVDVGARRESYA
jgi:hypothetical protein